MLSSSEKFLRVSGRPTKFYGTVKLPPSKSYLHRALFVSALASGESRITNCGARTNDDIKATVRALRALGARISSTGSHERLLISMGAPKKKEIQLYAGGSGTTARFLIPFCALTPVGTSVKITGNDSLSKRPMNSIFQPLAQLGVKARSIHEDGKLPILVEGGGIAGGECEVDGSVSSQFVSSLLISSVKARQNTTISIENPQDQVSSPYIEATISVMKYFGFKILVQRSRSAKFATFKIPASQKAINREFSVPGDMSSAATLIGAAIAAKGELRLINTGGNSFPQPDSAILLVAKKLGENVLTEDGSIILSQRNRRQQRTISLDLRDSPDLVPAVAGLAAATSSQISISNIGHLRFKESDRISVLSRELSKIGIKTVESQSSLSIFGSQADSPGGDIVLSPEGDHRMLMAMTIAGLSGRFGTIYIKDPDCVRKSYPSFVTDLQTLCHDKSTLKIVKSIKPRDISS